MSKKIAFVPFDDAEIIEMSQSVVDSFHRTTRFARTFRDQFDVKIRVYKDSNPKVLANISTGVQVYVFGHGEARATEITGGSPGSALTMSQLAARLKAAGLNSGHKSLKLHACRGGEGGSGSMAYNLWKALRDEQGFNAIKVCGYTKYLGSWVNGSGNKVGVDATFGDDGSVTSLSNETRQKDLRVCWP